MDFSLIPVDNNRFLNFIYLGLGSNNKSLIALFNTRGNTMVKESVAENLDLSFIDDDYIGENKAYKRAILAELILGGLRLEKVPVLVGKDSLFDLGKDQKGRENSCDMVLGWNIIKDFAWRGDFKNGRFEVQTSDFKKPNKAKNNQPIININIDGKQVLAAIDTSRPLSLISSSLAKNIMDKDEEIRKNLDFLGESTDAISHLSRLDFEIDGEKIALGPCQIDAALDDSQTKLVFGADLLNKTKWAIYGPMAYLRLKNY